MPDANADEPEFQTALELRDQLDDESEEIVEPVEITDDELDQEESEDPWRVDDGP
jgi:hypothetical protein